MPIKHLLEGSVFGPEEIKEIVVAFDGACTELGLVDRADQLVEKVAVAVIGEAERGARGEQIQIRALAILRATAPPSAVT